MSTDLAQLHNDLGVIWGASAIAKAIGRTRRQTFHLLDKGELKGATKIGGRWCITRDALLSNFQQPVVR